MKNVVRQIVNGVRAEMYDAIEWGYDFFSFEKDFDRSTVIVEGREVRTVSGYRFWDVSVLADHDNDHESPMLEQAVLDALPSYDEVYDEVDSDMRFN
jgi:hypothetical protein